MLQKTNAIQHRRTIATLIIGKKYDEIIWNFNLELFQTNISFELKVMNINVIVLRGL